MAEERSTDPGGTGSLHERLHAVWAEAARTRGRMPSEPSLAESLAISRPAVREALVRLEERGYIHRRKGADTAVNVTLLDIPARFDHRLDAADLIAAMGRAPRVDVLRELREPITLQEARQHDLPPATSVLRVDKLWFADDQPVLLARDVVPLASGQSDVDADASRPLVELAAGLTGERGEWEVVWPRASTLEDEDAAVTGRPAGEPALVLDVSGVSRRGRVCYWTTELHLQGAFRYAMVRRADWR